MKKRTPKKEMIETAKIRLSNLRQVLEILEHAVTQEEDLTQKLKACNKIAELYMLSL